LLLGAPAGGVEPAEPDAELFLAREPSNWVAEQRSDSARLRLGPNKDALAAIRDPGVTAFEPPGGLAVRAAILALNGYKEGARNDAQILGAKPLLLEDRALIAPFL
jgi:hypothetical protein